MWSRQRRWVVAAVAAVVLVAAAGVVVVVEGRPSPTELRLDQFQHRLEHGEVRTFAVERIERIEVLETPFEVPKDFNVSEYARGAFGIAGGKACDVVLEVDAAVAAYVRERVWHESQSVEERPDGGLVLRMKVAPGFELKSWIKSFLPHVRVKEPGSLRQEIAGEIEAARASFAPR